MGVSVISIPDGDSCKGGLMKSILIFLPKGGVGKTLLTQHLLVSASKNGFKVLGVDFDPQGSLTRWYGDRQRTWDKYPSLTRYEFDVASSRIEDWSDVFSYAREKYDLMILDMPPYVDGMESRIFNISKTVDLTLMPTGESKAEWEIALEWMSRFHERGRVKNTKFVINRVKDVRRKAFHRVQHILDTNGLRIPVSLPQRDEIFLSIDQGLTILDVENARSAQEFEQFWCNVKMELEL